MGSCAVPESRAGMRMSGEGAAAARSVYERFHPYYAELCALSELRKKPGFGVKLRSGMGGHCLLYLHGVRRDRAQNHPALKLCAPGEAQTGVGLSVNSHYKNANWVAAEGPDFLWQGVLAPGERLTREAYERTQAQAKAMGILDGVRFHDHLFRDKPAEMSKRDYMYEISVATDYAARFGRDIFRARIPLDAPRMAAVVDYLNGLNAPYRDGTRVFHWRLLNNNCAHVAHNALAAAGVWAPWPTGQFFALAAFNFPVPKNEFVDLMRRANDLPVGDAQAMYDDPFARRALIESGALPTAPGALAIKAPAIQDNDVYDTDRLRLIFYDNPFWGPYRFRFARIFSEPRYFDLRANLRHFAALYAAAGGESRGEFSAERAQFQRSHQQYITQAVARVRAQLACLESEADAPAEAVS
jgi:hypothetical protein